VCLKNMEYLVGQLIGKVLREMGKSKKILFSSLKDGGWRVGAVTPAQFERKEVSSEAAGGIRLYLTKRGG